MKVSGLQRWEINIYRGSVVRVRVASHTLAACRTPCGRPFAGVVFQVETLQKCLLVKYHGRKVVPALCRVVRHRVDMTFAVVVDECLVRAGWNEPYTS